MSETPLQLVHRTSSGTAVITGAASGLGHAFTQAAAARRFRLVIVDRDQGSLQALEATLRSQGHAVIAACLDVRDAAGLRLLAGQVETQFGAPTLLVNNAGLYSGGLLWEVSDAEWQAVWDTNLLGAAHGIAAFVPNMLRAASADADWRGRVVNVASAAGLQSLPLSAAYGISKHALVALTEILHHDFQSTGANPLRCSVLCPHFVDTGLADPDAGSAAGPTTGSQRVARRMVRQAMSQGRLDAHQIAELMFDGVNQDGFYLHTHPEQLGAVRRREADLRSGITLSPHGHESELAAALRRLSPAKPVASGHCARPVAVITGAASGIGLAMARHAAEAGWQLVLIDIEGQALNQAVCMSGLPPDQTMPIVADVADAGTMSRVAQDVLSRFGAPRLLINNAGVGVGGLMWEQSPEDWQWVAGVNVRAVLNGVRSFVPAMLAAAAADPGYNAQVLNTASMAGLLPIERMGAYGVTKHAVVALSEILSRDLGLLGDQVRASVLCPSFVRTQIGRSSRNRPVASQRASRSQRLHDALIQRATDQATTTAEEIARSAFDGLSRGEFYLLPHAGLRADAARRIAAIADGLSPVHHPM